jgi:hypothetical protein
MHAVAFALTAVLAGCAPADRPRLAEVLYDASGDDTNAEFVELLNPLDVAFPLAGLRLEAGDGANPGRWTLRWTGAATDSIVPRGRFVIGGDRVTPAPDRIVNLTLQNGPDAVRVVWPDGAVEVLGYGAVTDPALFCGAPAPDVASGFSLARTPDDSDRGSNALDFRAATPTPGRANQPTLDLGVVPASLALAPELPASGTPVTLALRVVNRGTTPIATGEARVEVTERFDFDTVARPLAATTIEPAIAGGETLAVTIPLAGLDSGKLWLIARAALAGDENPDDDRDSLRVRVGPGPVELTEIQFHPASGEGEWVEIRARDLAPVEIAALRLSDRTGTSGAAPADAPELDRDSLAVLAQDRTALLARFPDLDTTRVIAIHPWPSLNNSDDATGIADEVVVREVDGTLADRHAYSARGVPAGVPLERTPYGTWQASSSLAGTPLRPPRVLSPMRGRLDVGPRRLTARNARLRVSWSLPWEQAVGSIALHDLAGRRVATVLAEHEIAGRGELDWDGSALPGGVYVLVLMARDARGDASLSASAPLRVEGPAR